MLASASGDGTIRLWDTVPPASRRQQILHDERLRREAVPIVDRLLARLPDPMDVADVLRADDTLSADLRRAALRVLLTRTTRNDSNQQSKMMRFWRTLQLPRTTQSTRQPKHGPSYVPVCDRHAPYPCGQDKQPCEVEQPQAVRAQSTGPSAAVVGALVASSAAYGVAHADSASTGASGRPAPVPNASPR